MLLIISHDKLESLWHPTLNYSVLFSEIKSSDIYWWTGECGHEWQNTPTGRRTYGCPYCSGKKVLVGFNDLASNFPHLVSEWHPTKNGERNPENVSSKSSKKVWWICGKGHEWETKILHRSNGANCAVCSGNKILTGYNDIAFLHPDMIDGWHPTLNGDLNPKTIGTGYKKKIFWLCPEGHTWSIVIGDKIKNNTKCQVCANRVLLSGFNDLETMFPDIAKEWDYSKNFGIKPSEVIFNSGKKFSWVDSFGHEWETRVTQRTSAGAGCHYCSNNKLLVGFNDLASQFPEVAVEWHPTKNGIVMPDMVSKSSGKKVWWLGECGHEWEAAVANRSNGAGCRKCSFAIGAKKHATPISGVTDLLSQNPKVAAEWHPTKNGDLTPENVRVGSTKKVWWKCEKGHEWEVPIYSRRYNDCAKCSLKMYVSKPEKEIHDFLLENNVIFSSSDRSIIYPFELDVFVEGKNVAIEFNGLYWHSEKHKKRSYHYDKWLSCKDKGIELIQVWEDEWRVSSELVKDLLADRLGFSFKPVMGVNDVCVVELDGVLAQQFMVKNSLEGSVSGSHYFGLKDMGTGSVVGIMVVDVVDNTVSIVGFCFAYNVIGVFGLFLDYIQDSFMGYEIVGFVNNLVGDGGLYENNGFVLVDVIDPDYMYVVGDSKFSQEEYGFERFKNDPDLKFMDGLSLFELGDLNGLNRLWDAGFSKYLLKF